MIYACKPRKVSIYINTGKKTIAQVKAETGCNEIINGGLFDGAFCPVCHLKANGRVFAADKYKYWGYGWNENNVTLTADYGNFDNYIACVCLVRNGQADPPSTADMAEMLLDLETRTSLLEMGVNK